MSTGSRSRRRGRAPRCAGVTLVELMMTLFLMSLIGLVLQNTLGSINKADQFLTGQQRAARHCDRAAYEIHEAVASSRLLFERGARGNNYLNSLQITRWPPATNLRLPLPDETRDLVPDEDGDPRTGNVLLCVRESDPVACTVDLVSGRRRYVDVYNFTCVYPHQSTRRIDAAQSENARGLVIWSSRGYPSYAQVQAIEGSGDRTAAVQRLHALGYRHLWNPDQPAEQAFFAIDALGTINTTAEPSIVIEEDSELTLGERLVYGNCQLARTDPVDPVLRPVLTRDDLANWAPDGFEIKVVGASEHRKVWLRLVVQTQVDMHRMATWQSTLIASVRDL